MAVAVEDATELLPRLERGAAECVGRFARDVDREGRFPSEAIGWLKSEGLLGANVPRPLGGLGLSVGEVVDICRLLASHCSATAMTFAMHCIQVACLARHAHSSAYLTDFLRRTARDQLLIASVTSEAGVGGDLRRSIAAIEPCGAARHVAKQASTMSYGRFADAYLLIARRAPDAEESDQALALITREQATLERTGEWDALGMRGTCSEAFRIEATFPAEAVLPEPFAAIAERTMVSISHILWSACWLGIAQEAFRRARDFSRAAAAGGGLSELTLARLAEMAGTLEGALLCLRSVADWYEQRPVDADQTLGEAVRVNNLKLTASEAAQQVVLEALAVVGMAGYSEASKFSVARLLRDVVSSRLMIGNDRIKRTNGSALLAVHNLF
jgi:acyl-CoA dehydrogenase